jgi:TonB family protein
MKQKIKIMNHKQQPSDEEIQGYMDFDRVLENRDIALHSSRLSTIFKWSVPVLVGALVIIGFFMSQDNLSETVQPMDQEPVQSPQSAAPTPRVDSVRALEEEITKAAEPKKKADAPPPIVEKQPDEMSDNHEPPVKEEGYMQAEPLNGYPNLYDYFNATLVYPASALNDSIQGVQIISFVINKNGKVEQIEVEQSLGPEFEKESIRLIENMPEWKPAKLDGKPMSTRISIPITFQIQKIKN